MGVDRIKVGEWLVSLCMLVSLSTNSVEYQVWIWLLYVEANFEDWTISSETFQLIQIFWIQILFNWCNRWRIKATVDGSIELNWNVIHLAKIKQIHLISQVMPVIRNIFATKLLLYFFFTVCLYNPVNSFPHLVLLKLHAKIKFQINLCFSDVFRGM